MYFLTQLLTLPRIIKSSMKHRIILGWSKSPKVQEVICWLRLQATWRLFRYVYWFMNDSLSKLLAGSQIVLLGDFNIDFLAKKNDASFKLRRQLRQFAIFIANDLEQLINSPTRIVNKQERLLIWSLWITPTALLRVVLHIPQSAITLLCTALWNLVSPKPHRRQLNTVRIASTIRVLLLRI